MIGLSPSKKKIVKILQDVSGIVRSSRYDNEFCRCCGTKNT